MRVVALGFAAWLLSLAALLAGSALYRGEAPGGPDLVGFAAATLAAAVLIAGCYVPGLRWWWRRAPATGAPSAARSAALAATALNAPAYLLLGLAAGNRELFAGGEALLLGGAFALLGAAFGWGYARTHRRAAG